MASTSKAFNKCVDPCPRYLRWHTQSLLLLFGQGARTRCPWGENLCATSSTFAGRRHMIGKVVTGCVAILPYHTATQDRGSECRDFGFISRIVTALPNSMFHSSREFNMKVTLPKQTVTITDTVIVTALKGTYYAKIPFISCVAAVYENNQPIMVKIQQLIFL